MPRFLLYKIFFLVVLFVCNVPLLAQTASTTATTSTVTTSPSVVRTYAPLLFDEIRFDATTYTVGEVVSGFFTTRNVSNDDVPTKYRIELYVLNDTDDVNQALMLPFFYSAIETGDAIPAGSLQKNRFSFQLPNRMPEGDIVFAVQMYGNENESLVVSRTPLSLQGSRQYSLLPQNAILTINQDEVFLPADNPQVNKDEGIMLFTSVENTTKTAMRLKPVFTYYKGSSEYGEVLEEINHAQLFIEANGFASETYILPIAGRDPGPYTIVVTHVDAAGNTHTAPLIVRYVVGGMKSTIADVVYSGFDMNEIDTFTTTVSYKPVPENIRSKQFADATASTVASLELQATVFNEKGVVMYQSGRQTFDQPKKTTAVTLPNTFANGRYVIEFILYEDGVRIDQREDMVTIIELVNGARLNTFSIAHFFATFMYQIIVGFLLFISIGIFAIVLLFTYRKQEREVSTGGNQYVPKKFEVD